MQVVRNELPYAMDDARDELKKLGDWKHYVRKFPVAALACTAAVAYMAVPQKPARTVTKSPESEEVPKASIVGSLIGAATAMAIRSGTSFAVRQIGSSFSQSRGGR